jgi:small subunit ribosomal protein S6
LPVNTYEAMFILDPTKLTVGMEAAEQQIFDILRKHNAEIVASRPWDDRRLSYAIKGQKKGVYLLTFFKAEGDQLKEISADLRLCDLVLRELVTKIHPKLIDHLVNQAMTVGPTSGDGDERGAEEDDRPRRRRDRD